MELAAAVVQALKEDAIFAVSGHTKSFPGEDLKPSHITCGQGNNILHVAARYRGTSHVIDILKSDPLLANEANAKRDTPLHIAARLGRLDVVEILVEIIVKYEKKRLADAEAEYKKAQEEYMVCMEQMNNKGNNTPDEAELVKRLVAAENKRLEEAKTKYKHAQDEHNKRSLWKVNNEGNTALHEAVMNGHFDIAELPIIKDPTLTTLDNEAGESPLFLALDGGYQEIALLILRTFPNCSKSGNKGLTIVHLAVIRAHSYFLAVLLRRCGPEILVIPDDEFGWMPHHYATNMGISGILKTILTRCPVLALIKDKEGMSALHISAKNGHTRVIKTIMKECPDVCELLDNKGRTALHTAVEHKQVYALHALLSTIAFNDLLNEKDNEGNTAFHLACIYGHYEIIMRLLDDPRTNQRIINKEGMTAFDILNRSSIFGPFDKFMIKSQWRIRNPNSLQEVLVVRDTKERQKEGVSNIGEENKRQSVENTANINLLVATIIVSITFTAAITMPGGYESSNGLAHFRDRNSFRYFLAFDSLAFGCSAASMVMYFAVRLQSKLRGEAYSYPIHLTTLLTFLSITSTVSAFILGTYVVLYQHEAVPNSKSGFGLPGNIAFSAFLVTLLYFFLPLLRASCNYIKGILFDLGRKAFVAVSRRLKHKNQSAQDQSWQDLELGRYSRFGFYE